MQMARKKLTPEMLRTEQINIRFTNKEYAEILELSKGSELSPANWIRKFIFSKRFPKAKMSPITIDTFNELNKVGVNLNQLTRLANSGRLTGDLSGFLSVLNKHIVQIKLLLLSDSETNKG